MKMYCDGATTNSGGNTRSAKSTKYRAVGNDTATGAYLRRKNKAS